MLFQIEIRGLTDVLRPFFEDSLSELVEQLKQFLMFGQDTFTIIAILRSTRETDSRHPARASHLRIVQFRECIDGLVDAIFHFIHPKREAFITAVLFEYTPSAYHSNEPAMGG